MSDMVFCADVDLSHSTVDGNLVLQDVHFAGQSAFEWMVIRGEVIINNATFAEGADFTGMTIAGNARGFGNFRICDARFDGNTDFNRIRVQRNMSLGTTRGRSCGGPVFGDQVDLGGAEIDNNLDMRAARFTGAAHVPGSIVLLNDIHVGHRIELDPPRLPFGKFWLGVFPYDHVRLGPDGEKRAEAILQFVDSSAYSSEAYQALESYYRRVNPPFADRAFIHGKASYRNTYLCQWWNLCIPWWLNLLFLDLLVGYGRRTYVAIGVALAFVGLGWYLFRRRDDMDPVGAGAFYHGGWYSLDLFVPAINLRMAQMWTPRRASIRTYAYIHKIIGWLIVPIAIAYLSGIVK